MLKYLYSFYNMFSKYLSASVNVNNFFTPIERTLQIN